MNSNYSSFINITVIPPITPYVTISTFTLGENVANAKDAAPSTLPAMVTGRQPNLFDSAPTIGPEINN